MIRQPQSGNALFYILIAIVLIGLLTVALRDTGGMRDNIDSEAANLKAGQIISYSSELTQAVRGMLDSGISESELRFAHPDADAVYGSITTTPQFQVFSSSGGKALYRSPPSGTVTVANKYGFIRNRAMPQAGSALPDLTISLGYIADNVCGAINRKLGLRSVIDVATCGAGNQYTGTFPGTAVAISSPDLLNQPALQFCAKCADRGMNIYLSTILAR